MATLDPTTAFSILRSLVNDMRNRGFSLYGQVAHSGVSLDYNEDKGEFVVMIPHNYGAAALLEGSLQTSFGNRAKSCQPFSWFIESDSFAENGEPLLLTDAELLEVSK